MKTLTPQGDGNYLCLMKYVHEVFNSLKTLTPQGDGNEAVVQDLARKELLTLKTLTPQGDGNEVFSHFCTATDLPCFENTYPARGWKL